MNYFCNPININYRYQFNADPRLHGRLQVCREAADPTMICFQGRYYIFASMTLACRRSSHCTTTHRMYA